MIRLIVAMDNKRGIAKQGVQPWHIPEDENYFTSQTKTYGGNVLIGGITFRSALSGRPLKERNNYLLTRSTVPIDGVTLVHDLPNFLTEFDQDLWVIGGAQVYQQVIELGKADELYITEIDADLGCDQFLPEYADQFKQIEQTETLEQNGYKFRYSKLTRL